MYNVNFQDILSKITPSFLRKTKRMEFMYSFIKPLSLLNITFNSWKDAIDYDLQFNGQTMNLQHVLNDVFDSTSRGIYIEDTSFIQYQYIANKSEGAVSLYLANKSETTAPVVYLDNRVEQVASIHFKVKVPTALIFSQIEMRALVDKYKQAGKIYTIETY